MEVAHKLLLKVLLGLTALSFPLGLVLLNTEDTLTRIRSVLNGGRKSDLNAALNAKEDEIKEIDTKILQARGEFLKYAEMRNSQVGELENLRTNIERIITTPIPLDTPSKSSSSMNGKKRKTKARQ